jgi:hypothetical protein
MAGVIELGTGEVGVVVDLGTAVTIGAGVVVTCVGAEVFALSFNGKMP